jgi:hypothetical protein
MLAAALKKEIPMKPNELEKKAHELEETLNERMGEVARTKTTEDENQKLSVIQKKIKALLEDVDKLNGEDEKNEFIRQANELLLELRQSQI